MGCKGVISIVFACSLAIVGCGDDSTGETGGSGGSAGTGGVGGSGGAGGESGAGGAAGTGGAGGTGGVNTPPEATIVSPATDSGLSDDSLVYDGRDEESGLWYKDVMVEGLGEDAEDGTLSGASLEWKTDQTEIQAEVVGTGATPTIRLYSDVCFGTEHMVRLEVTDSDGVTTSTPPRQIFIWTIC